MYYTLYKITNTITNRIYVGVHQTENLNDGYMGSGMLLKRSQRKHGIENFKKEILSMYETCEDMNDAESVIVNEEFVRRKDTYNLVNGGGKVDNPKETEYYKSGAHTANMEAARKVAAKVHIELKAKRRKDYYENPTLCKHCNGPHPYDKKRNKFCSQSCSATYNNTRRVVTDEHKRNTSQTLKNRNNRRLG